MHAKYIEEKSKWWLLPTTTGVQDHQSRFECDSNRDEFGTMDYVIMYYEARMIKRKIKIRAVLLGHRPQWDAVLERTATDGNKQKRNKPFKGRNI